MRWRNRSNSSAKRLSAQIPGEILTAWLLNWQSRGPTAKRHVPLRLIVLGWFTSTVKSTLKHKGAGKQEKTNNSLKKSHTTVWALISRQKFHARFQRSAQHSSDFCWDCQAISKGQMLSRSWVFYKPTNTHRKKPENRFSLLSSCTSHDSKKPNRAGAPACSELEEQLSFLMERSCFQVLGKTSGL